MEFSGDIFKEEAYELLGDLETALLELEQAPRDMEVVGRIFRAMHTIKGSGAMFGFDAVADFTHHLESIFDRVRQGKISVGKSLVNLTLAARDHIYRLLDSPEDRDLETKGNDIIKELKTMVPREPEEEKAVPSDKAQTDALAMETSYRIRFKPHTDIFTSGTNPLLLLEELRELGDCRVIVHTEFIPLLEDLGPESCYLFWDILLTTDRGMNAIKDVFIFVEDSCELSIDPIIDPDINPNIDDGMEEEDVGKLGHILLDRGDISLKDLTKALEDQAPPQTPPKIGQILIAEKKVSPSDVESALVEQKLVRKRIGKKKEEAKASTIRVPADKLNQLVDLVGELVTVQARLSQKASTLADSELKAIAEDVEMLTGGLRDNAMNLRMLPIGTSFSNFKRLVRDLSGELGKEIELTTSGSETELDKMVIEQLKDPLVHIIRNSIDHGIETPEAREATGKPRMGSIHLSAEHSGANVLISIIDDGKGLDPEKIREKAVDKQMISSEADLSEKEIFDLIFAPGFSTAQAVTEVSGRGVGMDVVKKSIESLRGSIDLHSAIAKGTTITLKLPLTLAIIDGLLVTIGRDYFILPLAAVDECVELPRDETATNQNRQILNVRGKMVPYVSLRKEYGIREDPPELQQVVIMEVSKKRIGFVVDEVIGNHQTVIKNLGPAFQKARDISGASILGDGRLALIVDVNKIFDS